MKEVRVRPLLFCSIFVMAALPLLAAFYLLDRTLETSLDLGFNPRILRTLDHGAQNLKSLRRLDPSNQAQYRAQFTELQEIRQVYASPELLKSNVLRSLRVYFGAGLLLVVILSVLVAALLGRRISGAYAANFTELMRHRAQMRYLQEISSWQEMAKMLAHEIKNPLTPIEMLLSSLARSHRTQPPAEFALQLQQTESMVAEELGHLKNTVNRFSEFARLPQVQPVAVDIRDTVQKQLGSVAASFEAADCRLEDRCTAAVLARLDVTLFRQVLSNLVRNGLEANPARRVSFDLLLWSNAANVMLAVANDGTPVPPQIAERIFDPYVSSKSDRDNMGLGLAIVKKIVIEHGGDIEYQEQDGRPCFLITLPRLAPA